MKGKILAAALLLALSWYVQLGGGNAGDKDWLLYAAGMGLKGKKLYRDIVEVNPPLILWLYFLPAYVALKAGIDDSAALVALGFAVTAFSIFLSVRLLKLHPAFDRDKCVNIVLLLAFVLILRTSPSYFFDRDHIFLVLTLPYVLRWLPPIAHMPLPIWFRVTIGSLAAVGFAIKPHCLIVLAGIQLLNVLRERSLTVFFCVENIIIGTGLALYLLCVIYFAPDYMQTVFPMALATYGALNRRIDGLLYGGVAIFTLAVALCEFRTRQNSPYREDIYYLLGQCLFFLLYAATNNGWGYSYNPVICYALIASAWLVWHFAWLRGQTPDRQFTFGFRAGMTALFAHVMVAVLLIVAVVFGSQDFRCEDSKRCLLDRALAQEIQSKEGARSFSTLSPVVGSWSQLSKESGAAWETRFNCLWMLLKFFSSDAGFANENRWVLDFTARAVAGDIERGKPAVVFVDTGVHHTKAGSSISIPAYFSAYPEFKEAWAHYRFAHALNFCEKPEGPERDKANVMGCDFDVFYRIP